jgi:2-hydroxychromene-2-carboxylate isomerase
VDKLHYPFVRQTTPNKLAASGNDHKHVNPACHLVNSILINAWSSAGMTIILSSMCPASAITVYTDYKSPYAFLAKDRIYALARETGVTIDWRPYVLNIPLYLGSAEVGADRIVLAENRNAHQWRRVRYSYMDCRRQARKRGLIIRGTRKIFDSAPAAAGMLFAQQSGEAVFRHYHDTVFERFWSRDLDIEDIAALGAILTAAGADGEAFAALLPDGLARVAAISQAAEAAGVFGVPSFVVDEELFWGSEHLPDIAEMLAAR